MLIESIYGKPPRYNMTFSDVWPTADRFVAEYTESALYVEGHRITEDDANALYYLLYADYGNDEIASNDVNRFKYKTFSTIFQHGPTWEKELDIQKKLRDLSEADLMLGGTMIYNHSFNPSTAPSTATLEELQTVNDQNTTKNKKSKMEAYAQLVAMLQDDVTARFVSRFKNLFKKIVIKDCPLYYEEVDINE